MFKRFGLIIQDSKISYVKVITRISYIINSSLVAFHLPSSYYLLYVYVLEIMFISCYEKYVELSNMRRVSK